MIFPSDVEMTLLKSSTERHARARDNISAVLLEVEKVNEYFQVAKNVESVIQGGLNEVDCFQRDLFLRALLRLHKAHVFFTLRKKEVKASTKALKSIELLRQVNFVQCELLIF